MTANRRILLTLESISNYSAIWYAVWPLYGNTVIGTLAIDGWAVTFGTATDLVGLWPCQVPSSVRCTKCYSPPVNGQSIAVLPYNGPLLCGFNVPLKGRNQKALASWVMRQFSHWHRNCLRYGVDVVFHFTLFMPMKKDHHVAIKHHRCKDS